MARIVVERSHSLGREVARQRAEKLAEKLERDFAVSHAWQGDVLAISRSGADGRIEVGEDRVRVELTLGLLLSAMSAGIQAQIERSLDKALQA
ncbi:polyhydroxyalkanoic acid system family protein [Stutzerimonas azotifigens]|uniref:polyhydroxyalkanoic acid system family protein n=1 Tax=Stutzerimonas azotifigens TaxID=291995 RepID=UPI0003F8052F|nr:polyhydroxyalkanoic acid system family protein [Stutzerimonas azotifigens]